MRRIISISISIIMVLTTCASAEVVSFPSHPVIGIAWRPDEDSEFYTNVCKAVEAAGGSYIMLPQVKSPDLDYDEEGRLTEGITEAGALTWDAAKRVRCNTWQGSNAPEVAAMVSAVILPAVKTSVQACITLRNHGMALRRSLITTLSVMCLTIC